MEVLLVLGCCVGGASFFWVLSKLALRGESSLEEQRKEDSLTRGSDREQ